MKIVAILGSRNPAGQTARAADALLQAAGAGGQVDKFFLPQMKIEHCHQCDEKGWGLCRSDGRCVIQDDFASITDKLRAADLAVFANPVYFGDLSESLKAYLDRLRRIGRHETGKAGVATKPAVGICVAGGGGGGAPSCVVSMERVLGTCGFDVLDLVPVRRQNLEMKTEVLALTGKWLKTQVAGK